MKKKIIPFSQITYGWNNITNAINRNTLLSFGEYDVDYFTKDHHHNSSNQNIKGTDVSKRIFINGRPIKDLDGIVVNNAHGHNYFLISVPYHHLFPQNGYKVTTLHIEEGTKFLDSYLGEVNLYLVNDQWVYEKPSVVTDETYSSLLTVSNVFHQKELSIKDSRVIGEIDASYPFSYGQIFSIKDKDGSFSLSFNNLKINVNKSSISILDNDSVLGSFTYPFRVDEQYELLLTFDSNSLSIALDGIYCFKCDYQFNNNKVMAFLESFKGESSHSDTYLGNIYKKPIISYYGQDRYYVQIHSESLNFKGRYAIFDPYDGLISDKTSFEWPKGSLNELNQINEGTWEVMIKVTDSKGFSSSYKVTVIASDIYDIHDGQVIDLVPLNIQEYFAGDPKDFELLNSVYEYNDEMSSFMERANDPKPRTRVVSLYEMWDGCRQFHNRVRWDNKKPSIDHFEIVLALDENLTDIVEEDKNISKEVNSYRFLNLLINQDYYYQITTVFKEKTIKSKVFRFKTKGYSRFLTVEGVSNIRDCGGYQSEFGEIKQGLMFRGARLDDLTDKGRDILLNKLHIKCDLDLRGHKEGDVNPLNLPYCYQRSIRWYHPAIIDESSYPSMKEALCVFFDEKNYPLYYHCSVGRDRTGTIGVIIDALLGADENRIMRNYFTSMFSVTGSIPKPMTLFGNNLLELIKELKALGGSNLKESAEIFVHKVGINDEQIDNLRKIMTGKIL